ncbi:hemerythrin domain-containing protein [Ramlibacter ginsenosidimutans]|uniref:Hemerythrin domain-containing protein n=1 Tax=Ramlibacter ginsenosidimutans TaxID=502333 RepID=A0A934WLM6_9BURK|nr:hemerythrin domain-containing protein [Ramlibacter ginsenosidimutans]MBK6005568.1 hemerythrin domain-containing protein [Ramlibacter ginsenosidimutans]
MHTTSALQTIRDEHAAVAAVLRSMLQMLDRDPDQEPERYFDVLRAMLFYIDEFPERRHHPKESDLLFPKLARVAPQLMPVIKKLEDDHMSGEHRVRELQHLLLAWELLGDSRRPAFDQAARAYADFYLHHMRTEETELLPVAQKLLSASDWEQLNAAFSAQGDPLVSGVRDPMYDRLFTRIVMRAPAPIGVGPE